MTVSTTYYNWQTHKPAPDPQFAECSPNLRAIFDEMGKRWGCTDLGCYGWRPIRGGQAPSSHGFGAARDIRYDHAGRGVAEAEILPWLIEHSEELHISSIHDYFGCRIWHAGRGWKIQPQSIVTGMGQRWATYFHLETTPQGWADAEPVTNRTSVVLPNPSPDLPPEPAPAPAPAPQGNWLDSIMQNYPTIRQGSSGGHVAILSGLLYARGIRGEPVANNFDAQVDAQVRQFQGNEGLEVDGLVGPRTWTALLTA